MWILKFLPDWFFYVLLFIGIFGLIISKFIPSYYKTTVQATCAFFVVFGVYMAGAISNNNEWIARVKELEAKIAQAEAESSKTNTKIVEKVVVKREYYKQKGNDVIQYIDREVVKYDNTCKIPPEFIEAHNKAAVK
jgi:uncharacterized protein YqfA (UPF0365 family)